MIDLFDCRYDFQVTTKSVRYSTLLGSITTILIVVFSLVYAIINFITWVEGGMQPLVTIYKDQLTTQQYFNLSQLGFSFLISGQKNLSKIYSMLHLRFKISHSDNNQTNYYLKSHFSNTTNPADQTLKFQIPYCHQINQLFRKDLEDKILISRDKVLEYQLVLCSSDVFCYDQDQINELFQDNLINIGGNLKLNTFDYHNHIISENKISIFTELSPEIIPTIIMTFTYVQSHIDYGYPFKSKQSYNNFINYQESVIIQKVAFQLLDRNLTSKFLKQGIITEIKLILLPISERIEVQHQNIIDIIIMAFGFFRMLSSFACITIKQRAKQNLQNLMKSFLNENKTKVKEWSQNPIYKKEKFKMEKRKLNNIFFLIEVVYNLKRIHKIFNQKILQLQEDVKVSQVNQIKNLQSRNYQEESQLMSQELNRIYLNVPKHQEFSHRFHYLDSIKGIEILEKNAQIDEEYMSIY